METLREEIEKISLDLIGDLPDFENDLSPIRDRTGLVVASRLDIAMGCRYITQSHDFDVYQYMPLVQHPEIL